MLVERLLLADFRNFAANDHGGVEVPFGSRFTVLAGHNGAGKTNVIEALYLTSTLRSFRGAELVELLGRGHDAGRVELVAFDEELGVRTRLEVRIERTARATRRTARVDDKLVRSAADFHGRLQAILFTPEDLDVLRGPPSGRRQFIDRVVFARARVHIADVQAYEKLLRSRNRVLKADIGQISSTERGHLLDTYDQGIGEVGARIWTRRESAIEELRAPFRRAFTQIFAIGADHPECDLRYVPRLGLIPEAERESALHEDLRRRRETDLQRGTTNTGPHRDDLEFTFDGVLAGHFASQGQMRGLILAFKIAELRDTRDRLGRRPLLLLDDVSSELDPDRNERLFATLSGEVGQCVITTTAATHITLHPKVPRLDLAVENGRFHVAATRD